MRRRKPSLRSLFPTLTIAAACAASAAGCATDFDNTREARPAKTTLGEDIFTTLCDRVGASSFTEDLDGSSYRDVCHKSSKGWKGLKVDTRFLPPAAASGAESRRRSIAKVEAMARHRADLIEAFDTIFPDIKIDDPRDPEKQVRLYDALDLLTKRLTPLYESSPYSKKGDPDPDLMPATTRTLAATFGALADSPEAQRGLAQIAARQGYRPSPLALGSMRTMLAYPELRAFSRLLIDRTGPGGPLEDKFQHLLRVAQQELRTLEPDPPMPAITVDDATVKPNRPRLKLEIISQLLLSQHPDFARTKSEPRFLAARDLRGFVVPQGSNPGHPGSVPSPFVDQDGDGYADIDLLGRFVDTDGDPILAPPPFMTPYVPFDEAYTFDEASRRARSGDKLVYSYLDTSQTLLGSVAFDLKPLIATQGDGPSTLMKTLEGSYALYGDRKTSKVSFGKGDDQLSFEYEGFDPETSPLVDLTHATGQLLGAPESDDYLGSILQLHEEHPEKTGRALALSWAMWNKSKDPQYAQAVLADTSTFWDDMADWIARAARVGPEKYTGAGAIAQPRGLLSDLTLALASPAAGKYLPDAFGAPMTHVDRLSYQPGKNINGAPLNASKALPITSGTSYQIPVNRSLPDQGDNRSAFQRFAHVIHAADHVNACNKAKALVKSSLSLCNLPAIDLTYPIKVPIIGDQKYIDECDLFEIRDLGVFFVDAVLPWNHPRRSHLVVKQTTLTGIIDLVSKLTPGFCGEINMDSILQNSTGLNGLTTKPTPQALTRLVFYGARQVDENGKPTMALPPVALDPFLDGQSKGLTTFVENTLDLVGTSECPQDARGVNVCTSYEKTLRGIEPGTFFVAETPFLEAHPPECKALCDSLPAGTDAQNADKKLCYGECAGPTSGFYEGIRPLLTAFASYSYDPEPGELCQKDQVGRCVGEQLFVDLIGILDKHWPSETSGINRYEEFLAWAFSNQNDLFGVAQDLVPTLRDQQYVSPRVKHGQPRPGLEITASLLSYLFDQQVAKGLGITDRHGAAATTRNDGTPKAQVTPYDLIVQALRGMDKRFANDPEKKARWRQARSELVDQFMLAEGTSWKNPAIARALPILGRLVREQVNANCPDRESTQACKWARDELPKKLAAVMGGPLFGAINDLQEALRGDDEARLALEKLLAYLLEQTDDADSLALTLTSLGDLLQVLHDDNDIAPVLNAMSVTAAPGLVEGERADDAGIAHMTLKVMKVMLDDHDELPAAQAAEQTIDRYHVLDGVLRNLVTPPGEDRQAPLEVILDTIADVQRIDSSDEGPLSAEDYRAMGAGLRSFLVDEYRGMEQFYTIVRRRNEQ
jgi:hypothetical protein